MPYKIDPETIPEYPDFSFEAVLWENGLRMVAGIDEAGRGALAGPVSAAALIFPPEPGLAETLAGVNDSKLLKPGERSRWAERLQTMAVTWGIGFATNDEIDRIGIVPATRLAVMRALGQLTCTPEHLLVDYLQLPESKIPFTPLVKGDRRSLSIASASILAKTARDQVLCSVDECYPGYGFASHKGYGTIAHLKALAALGPSPLHRTTFHYREPVHPGETESGEKAIS